VKVQSVCETCVHLRVVEAKGGSRFLRCLKAKHDPRFAKYPPQPLAGCLGHEERPQHDPPGSK